MTVAVAMPRLSDSMEEGTIVRWLKAAGEHVSAGEPIVEIETDKATMAFEAEADGVLEITAAEGTTLPLGGVIARILPAGDSARPAAAVRPRRARVAATPIARRLAAELGIDLAGVRGTGRRGHVVKADVQSAATAGNGRVAPAGPELGAAAADDGGSRSAVSGARRLQLTVVQRRIAARMSESHAAIPDFELEVEIEMDACMALRSELAVHADPVPSINDMVVKACALALASHPRVNGAYRDDAFELYERVNVGIAVAAEDALLVPVIHDADRLSLVQIAAASRGLAERVRAGQITPPELSGATFTVSNLGMYGITRFTAVINPPQAAILAVGAVGPRAVARDGELAIANVMSASLASDHRILYGADAAAFLGDVRRRLQAPISLLA